ncbi:hypothetical protein Efla_003608 [Eimeria flavescens]
MDFPGSESAQFQRGEFGLERTSAGLSARKAVGSGPIGRGTQNQADDPLNNEVSSSSRVAGSRKEVRRFVNDKSVHLILFCNQRSLVSHKVARVSTKAIADGYRQMGQPFRFDKNFVVAPAFEESRAESWWPATGRPALKPSQRPHLDETFDVAMHTDTSFPSPFEQPEKCVSFPSLSHSWICDPDQLLSPQEQAFVETRLLKLRDTAQSTCNESGNFYQAAVAVASDIVVNENETPQEATDRFAGSLLRRWGVGNKGCHDGMVLAFVKNLKTN